MDRTFFEDYGLFRKFHTAVDSTFSLWSMSPKPIQRHCERCQGERTFNEMRSHRLVLTEQPRSQEAKVLGNLVNFTFFCASCHTETIQYIVRCEQKYQLTKIQNNAILTKIGQFPAFDVQISTTLRDALGDTFLPIMKKGLVCEKQGFGVGAFGYYRRIVELVIDGLIEDIRMLLDGPELARYEAAILQIEKTIVAKEKIAVVKELLPAVLRPGGNNPLGLLHDALSVGLHDLDDEDCLALAEGIRESLEMLLKHIALAKDDRGRIANSLNSLRDNLNKIRSKRDASD